MHLPQTIPNTIKRISPSLWIVIRSTIGLFSLPFRSPYAINYYPELHTAYIRVPKAANTTIGALFLRRLGIEFNEQDPVGPNVTSGQFLISKGTFSELKRKEGDLYTVTFVRNPYTRLISCYRHILKTQHTAVDAHYFGVFKKDMTFDQFARWVCRIPDAWADPHFRSQASMVVINGTLPDYIGKTETLEGDIQFLSKKIGLPTTVTSYNTTSSCDPYDLSKWYTPDLAQLVQHRYRKDFKIFGYSTEL